MMHGFVSLLFVFVIFTTTFASEGEKPDKLYEIPATESGWCGEIAIDDETFQQMKCQPLLVSKENVAENYIEFMSAAACGSLSRYTHLFTKNVKKNVNGLAEAVGVEDLFSQVNRNCMAMGMFWNVGLLAKNTELENENKIKITYTVKGARLSPQFNVDAILTFSEEGEISFIDLRYTQQTFYPVPSENLIFTFLDKETCPERPD